GRAEKPIRNRADMPAELGDAGDEDVGTELGYAVHVGPVEQHRTCAACDRLPRELQSVMTVTAAGKEQRARRYRTAVQRDIADDDMRRRGSEPCGQLGQRAGRENASSRVTGAACRAGCALASRHCNAAVLTPPRAGLPGSSSGALTDLSGATASSR